MSNFLSEKGLINAPLTTGTENQNDAGNYVFASRVRKCLITNQSANDYAYRANSGADVATASTEASVSSYDGVLLTNTTTEISLDSNRIIKDVSIFFPTGQAPAANDIRVMGLPCQ